ncbi:MAG: glycosyltransferase family 4 protein [Candidatus Bathyarchaeia archaeon]
MASKIRLCVNTQTPLIMFKIGYSALLEKYGELQEPVSLKDLTFGEDYEYAPGGVTAMVYPLLRRLLEDGYVGQARWISLSPNAPPEVVTDGITLHHIQPDREYVAPYTNFKEGIWREFHDLGPIQFEPDEYQAYAIYNWLSAQLMLKLVSEVDLFWIHDFQQLQVGNLIGPSAPAIFRWHIPFNFERVSPRMRTFILKSIEGYDAVVVSTKRDLEGLIRARYHGKAYQAYPSIDARKWTYSSPSKIEDFEERFRLRKTDTVILYVSRMDFVKSQDIAIKALPLVLKKYPDVKLLLVGNGSFSGTRSGGLAHPKSSLWKTQNEEIAKECGVVENVIFSGHLSEDRVRTAYSRADMCLLPSRTEGFGLTIIEAWQYKKPVIVSRGAGVAELINEGVNGYTFEPGNVEDLASKIEIFMSNKEKAVKLGESGFDTGKLCHVDRSTEVVKGIFDATLDLYK